MTRSPDRPAVRLTDTAAELRRLAFIGSPSVGRLARAGLSLSRSFAELRRQLYQHGHILAPLAGHVGCRVFPRRCPHPLRGADPLDARDEMHGLAWLCGRFARPELIVVHRDEAGELMVDASAPDGLVRIPALALADLLDTLSGVVPSNPHAAMPGIELRVY
jgi:hypothetical protein